MAELAVNSWLTSASIVVVVVGRVYYRSSLLLVESTIGQVYYPWSVVSLNFCPWRQCQSILCRSNDTGLFASGAYCSLTNECITRSWHSLGKTCEDRVVKNQHGIQEIPSSVYTSHATNVYDKDREWWDVKQLESLRICIVYVVTISNNLEQDSKLKTLKSLDQPWILISPESLNSVESWSS